MAAGAGVAAVVWAEDVIRFSRNVPGEAKPVVIDADEIVTWTEGDTRVLLLRGQVLLQHGLVRVQFQNGVLFVDLKGYEATRVWNVEVYGEGDASVQNGADISSGPAAFLDLHTRGELKLNAHKGQVTQAAKPDDPVYMRGAARRAGHGEAPQPRTTADAIQRTGYDVPAGGAGAVVPAQATTPAPAPAPTAPLLPPVPPNTVPGGMAVPGQPGAGPATAVPPGGLLGPLGATPPGAPTPVRQFTIVPRNLSGYRIRREEVPAPPGQPREWATIVTGGIILTVRSTDPKTNAVQVLDVEADRAVIWTRGEAGDQADGAAAPGGLTGQETEFYLSGNVEIRERSGKDERTLRADEIYYDVSRNVALALSADVEWRQPGVPDMLHFTADEVQQLSPEVFRGIRGTFFSSKLPSDPGLKVVFAEATLEEKKRLRRTIFGREVVNLQTDQPVVEVQKLVRAEDIFLRVEDVPVFYFPFMQGDANDPLGPVRNISIGYNNIFGLQINVSWDLFDLLGIDRIPNWRWHMDTDYLSLRGPALGTELDFAGKDLCGPGSLYSGMVKGWTIYDTGKDILGGTRDGQPHPNLRDRVQIPVRADDIFGSWSSAQFQFAHFSDQNVHEQYDKIGFDTGPNQETFLYGKFQQPQANWAATLLAEERLRDWFTETNWLPRADGYLIGQSFCDLFTYDARANIGYAQLRPASAGPPPVSFTDVAVDTGRADLFQWVYVPFYLGPVKVVPYGALDLTYYTSDIEGQSLGRVYGGGGVMASIPFTRLYPDVHSLLWNLNGINHKIVLSGNYYIAGSSEPYTKFPQLDQLNDNVNDYSLRYMKPLEPVFNPANGLALATSPVYDPQVFAIRSLVENKIDTLGTIQELQLDLRQRWQTKRGFPGQEHIIDWMTLDLSAAVFPAANRDNFGNALAFLQYDWSWNIGDRTALASSGWVDPEKDGPRFFSVGAYLNRTDRTNLFLGYRQIDPLESKAVTAAVTYVFSPKYSMTASSTYDFGTSEALSNSLVLTRMGSDIQVSFGITYNALTASVGVQLEIVPNLLANKRIPGLTPGLLQQQPRY
jgi:hypothetical protein